MVKQEELVALLRRWEEEAAQTDRRMKTLMGSRWYSSLSEEERKQYRVLQAEYTARRSCANELALALDVEAKR